MIIKCLRCGKELDSPNDKNADYIVAKDTVTKEPREVLVALVHNQKTLEKQAMIDKVNKNGGRKYPGLSIEDSEYEAVEIPNLEASQDIGEDLVKVLASIKEKDVQKTGIICPDCYNPDTDTVIWGVHKQEQPIET